MSKPHSSSFHPSGPVSARRRTVLQGFAGAAALAGVGSSALAQQSKEAPALAKLVSRQAGPMRTTAMPSNYRRQVAAALAKRLVRELATGNACHGIATASPP